MTKEEAIQALKKEKRTALHENKAAFDMAIKALEQETVLKESYDREYFLRKEFEIKIDELQRQLEEQAVKAEFILEKIREEIEQDAFKDVNGSKYIFVNRVNQIIDKYKVEQEET